MKTAVLRLGRCYDPSDLIRDSATARTMYDRKAFVEHPDGVPVLIDHDDDRVIGRARRFFVADDIVAGQRAPWHFALVDGDLPGWVKRGTGVSVGSKVLQRSRHEAVEIVNRAMLDEISVLSSAMRPVNVGASVQLVRERSEPATRNVPVADPKLVELRQGEAAARGIIYRPAIGRILGVR